MSRAEGTWGEAQVANFLRRRGYQLLAHSYHCRFGEVDLIARQGSVLCFVEVKTRRSGSLTPPEAAATQRKFRALTRAAARYLRTAGWQGEVQFDLAAVTLSDDGRADVELIERAMEHHW